MPLQQLPVVRAPTIVPRVRVKTTLPITPLPPNSLRQPILTPRLLIRPWEQSDLAAVVILRTQPEVMRVTAQARVDLNQAETQAWLNRFLPPHGDVQTHSFAICLRETGELIGTGGVHSLTGVFGWPELGYMFRTEYWGKGYATEFLRAYMEVWRGLERTVVEVEVDPRTVEGAERKGEWEGEGETGTEVEEQIIAITADDNVGSQNVLCKCRWEHFITFPWSDASNSPTFRWFPTRKGEE